jgi:hypothetical protein
VRRPDEVEINYELRASDGSSQACPLAVAAKVGVPWEQFSKAQATQMPRNSWGYCGCKIDQRT